jgi:hypothetical protein
MKVRNGKRGEHSLNSNEYEFSIYRLRSLRISETSRSAISIREQIGAWRFLSHFVEQSSSLRIPYSLG